MFCVMSQTEIQLISSVQFLDRSDRLGRGGAGMSGGGGHDGLTIQQIFFQSFLRETIVSSSGMGMGVLSLTFSVQHFLCRPRRRSPSKVP